ncbi:MAG: hypothetical protein IMF08_02060 [Proteobacteria bacterium]|nr:hypothetical protein [Pseudomonadota bacterium]
MEAEEENPFQVKTTGSSVVYLIGLFTALVSGSAFLAVSLFFMELGHELCWNRPDGTILSNPSWSCDLQLGVLILGVGLFGLYSLPYGLTAAWIGDRWRILGNLGFPRSHEKAERPLILIFFPLITGTVGAAVMFPILFFLFPLFKLLLIPIAAFLSAGLCILIFIDYSRRKIPAGR